MARNTTPLGRLSCCVCWIAITCYNYCSNTCLITTWVSQSCVSLFRVFLPLIGQKSLNATLNRAHLLEFIFVQIVLFHLFGQRISWYLTYLAWLRALWLNFSVAVLRKVLGGGWGAYGVFLCPGEVDARQQLPHRECCRYREGLQLLLWVTFITTINMRATHRHTGLGWMLHYKYGQRGMIQLDSDKKL